MNKRIKELAEQAGCTEGYYESDDGPFIEPEFNKEKFAELMLKAAFDVVINDSRFHDAKGIIRAGKYTAMEHFGVEE